MAARFCVDRAKQATHKSRNGQRAHEGAGLSAALYGSFMTPTSRGYSIACSEMADRREVAVNTGSRHSDSQP
jgi:hypothetical protein